MGASTIARMIQAGNGSGCPAVGRSAFITAPARVASTVTLPASPCHASSSWPSVLTGTSLALVIRSPTLSPEFAARPFSVLRSSIS